MSAELHPLLARVLRKVGATTAVAPSDDVWRALLQLVSRTYHDSDQDRYTLERSIDISSREMQGLYQDLQRRSESALAAERDRVAQSNAVLRATLEATIEGIMVVDAQRRILAANGQYAKLLHVPDDVMATNDHHRILDHATRGFPAGSGASREAVEEIHASREIVHDEIVHDRGGVFDRYSAPVTLPDGGFVGRVTFLRDVTAERTHRTQLENARAAAEQASQAKSMFLANMSHELRTPLNAVIGLADLLLLDAAALTARQREYLEGIAQSGRHLLAMVNDVLDLAKIEAGKQDLELERVATRDAVAEAVSLLAPLAEQRGVALVADVAADAPQLRADPLRLRQILYNLISNAVKFTNRDGRVRVSAHGEGERVAIAVADTGIGIAPTDISRLYRAFEQLDQPSGVRPSGTGLGLALTKRLVDMHGGTIDVASQLGAGTTFTVRLPVA